MSNIDDEFHKKIYFIINKLSNISSHLKILEMQLHSDDVYIYPYHTIICDEIEFYKLKLFQYSELYYNIMNV